MTDETWITSDADGGCSTLLLPTPLGALRVRISGPGRRAWARRRREWEAQKNLALLAELAEKGDVVGKLLAEDGAINPVERMPLQEALEIAARLRRCLAHVHAHGLPPTGHRACVAT